MIQTSWQWGQKHERFAPNRVIAYDSEFVRERHYYPKLSLIQIADQSEHAYLYDALQSPQDIPWSALFSQSAPLLFHAGSQDLELIRQYTNTTPHSIRDTQLGFALLQPQPTISFAALIEHYLGFVPNKSQTRSDWLQRPLMKEQLNYAANDVGLLLRVYPKIVADLQAAGRLPWWAEECSRLLQTNQNIKSLQFYWYHLPFAPQLRGKTIIIADILTHAREKVAQTFDKPRRIVLPDKILFELATKGVDSTEALAEWLPPEHLLWRELEYLQNALDNWQSHRVISKPDPIKLNSRQYHFYQRLQLAIKKKAEALNIHPHTIINPKTLRQWCSEEKYQQGLLREGWRGLCLNDIIDKLAP